MGNYKAQRYTWLGSAYQTAVKKDTPERFVGN